MVSTTASLNAPERLGRYPCAMALMRHRLPLLLAPVLAAPGRLPAPACHPQRLEDPGTPQSVGQDIENKTDAEQDT